jgi:hypothetical protein
MEYEMENKKPGKPREHKELIQPVTFGLTQIQLDKLAKYLDGRSRSKWLQNIVNKIKEGETK